ncbi:MULTISPECIES: response regulator FixJ [Phenylobacterium]|jgi:two-component system response regulator FixJ|uniref:Response regulator FixJ n=1 Tax=Phenylobacterium conjunctum TaxID=1298959 RepID=A0ABW3T821_9CAUL
MSDVVHVIDDDEAMRESLDFLLDASGFRPRTYAAAADFLAVADTAEPGCIVTDIRMPGMNGLELVGELRARGNSLPIVVITGHGDVPLAVEAMKAGVADFLEKPFSDDVLLATIRRCLDGLAQSESHLAEAKRINEILDQLSPRERDVLKGVVAGKPNKVIAHELGISPRTVEVYRANVMTKTRANAVSDLVRMAMVVGL